MTIRSHVSVEYAKNASVEYAKTVSVEYAKKACKSRVFSQHPAWVYYTNKPIENAVYCFYDITRKKDKVLSSESMFLMVIKLRLLLTIIM